MFYVPPAIAESNAHAIADTCRFLDPASFRKGVAGQPALPIMASGVKDFAALAKFAKQVIDIVSDPQVQQIIRDIVSAVRNGLVARQKSIIRVIAAHPRAHETRGTPEARNDAIQPKSTTAHVRAREEMRFAMGVLGLNVESFIRFLITIRTIGIDELAEMAEDL